MISSYRPVPLVLLAAVSRLEILTELLGQLRFPVRRVAGLLKHDIVVPRARHVELRHEWGK